MSGLANEQNFQSRSEVYQGTIPLDYGNHSRTIQFGMIREGSTVLDVGCANGEMGECLAKLKKCTVDGMEYNPISIRNAEATNCYRAIHQVDLNQIRIEDFPDCLHQFDFILFGDVLEHLVEPQAVLQKFRSFLKSGGSFVISLPNLGHASIKARLLNDDFEYAPSGILDFTHLRFFTWRTLPSFFSKISMRIEKATGVVMPPELFGTESPMDNLPLGCRRKILKNIYSWVFQFVLSVSPTEDDEPALLKHNEEKMTFTRESLPSDILFYTDRSHYLKMIYGPSLKNFWHKKRENGD